MLQCQQGRLTRQHLVLSLVIHLGVIILLLSVASFRSSKKNFVVLGAHSSKEMHAYFRPLRAPKTSSATVASKRRALPKAPVKKKPSATMQRKASAKKQVAKPKPKPVIKKVAPVVKKPEPVKTPKPEPVLKQEAKTEVNESLPINLSENIDPRFTRYQIEVQREITRVWKPPVGVTQGTECVLLLGLSSSGEVKNFEIAEKSLVLVYDLSVLQAAKDFKFSESLWGNSLLITFRQ